MCGEVRSFPRVSLRLPWASIVVPLQGTSAYAAHDAGVLKAKLLIPFRDLDVWFGSLISQGGATLTLG